MIDDDEEELVKPGVTIVEDDFCSSPAVKPDLRSAILGPGPRTNKNGDRFLTPKFTSMMLPKFTSDLPSLEEVETWDLAIQILLDGGRNNATIGKAVEWMLGHDDMANQMLGNALRRKLEGIKPNFQDEQLLDLLRKGRLAKVVDELRKDASPWGNLDMRQLLADNAIKDMQADQNVSMSSIFVNKHQAEDVKKWGMGQ